MDVTGEIMEEIRANYTELREYCRTVDSCDVCGQFRECRALHGGVPGDWSDDIIEKLIVRNVEDF